MDGDTLWLEVAGVLYFGSAARLEDRLEAELVAHPEATGLVLDLRRVGRIDYTSAAVIQRVATDIEEAGMTVRVIAAGPPQGLVLLERLLGPDSPWLESGEP
jgi:SulP family sulfate permease